MSEARDEILNKLKRAVYPVTERPDFNEPVFFPVETALDELFKKNLELVNGTVRLFESENDLFDELKNYLTAYHFNQVVCNDLFITSKLKKFNIPFYPNTGLPENTEVGITTCEFLVAHTGSVMVSSALKGGRQWFVFPNVHIVIARREQLVDTLSSAYAAIQNKYASNLPSQITLVTGPSRTADIEKTLILGAHGPRELRVYLY